MAIKRLLIFVVVAFMFLGAATYTIENYSLLTNGYKMVHNQPKSNALIQKRKIPVQTKVKGAEIAQQLFVNNPNVPITVDGYTFPNPVNVKEIDIFSQIDKSALYDVSVTRDKTGEIAEIHYTKS
jgi:hypothetical protein